MTVQSVADERLRRAQDVVREAGIEVLLATPSSDLFHLIGYPGHASERPTVLAVPAAGDPAIVLPQLEATRLAYLKGVTVHTYGETEDPYAVLAQALGDTHASRVAISDQAWATVLLGLQALYPRARFEPAGPLLRAIRMYKAEDELDAMRRAAAAVDRAIDALLSQPFAGRSERELAEDLTRLVTSAGVGKADWGPIVASGPNSASPHHLTGERTIAEGDSVILDYGATLNGYQADTTRTVHVGPADEEYLRVYETVQRAQEAAVHAVRPGISAESVDAAARNIIADAGYSEYFIHRTGHGIGLDTHEEPYIVQGNELELRPGMTFSIEPGIYIPGRFGVRIEDIVAVTESGVDRLNTARRDLQIVR